MFAPERIGPAGVRYRPIFRFAEDYDLWLRLSRTARLANLPEELYRAVSPAGGARIRRPWPAFTGVMGAWMADFYRRLGLDEPFTDDVRPARAANLARALAGQAHLFPPVLEAALHFGWRLALPVRLLAAFGRRLEAAAGQKEGTAAAAAEKLLREGAPCPRPISSVPTPEHGEYFRAALEQFAGGPTPLETQLSRGSGGNHSPRMGFGAISPNIDNLKVNLL